MRKIKKDNALLDVVALSLFPKVHIRRKFKMLELDMFDRSGCPKTYFKMYANTMTTLHANAKLLAQMF